MPISPYFGSGYFGSGYFGSGEPAAPGSLRATVSAAAIIVGTASGQAALFGVLAGTSTVNATATDGVGPGFVAAAILAGASVSATASFTGEPEAVSGGGGYSWVSYRAPPLVPRFLWALRIKAGAETTGRVVGAVFARAAIKAGSETQAQATATASAAASVETGAALEGAVIGAAAASAAVSASATTTASGSASLVINDNFQFDATEDEMAMIFSLAA